MPARVVAHSVDPFLFKTGSWVHAQLVHLSRWKAIGLAKTRENQDTFPFEPVYALEHLSPLARARASLSNRLIGGFPQHRRAMRAHGASVLHSHFGNQGWSDIGLARATGAAHVTSFYGADAWKSARRPRWPQRYRELFARGDLFLAEGPAMKARLEALGCPPGKAVVQHLGVALDRIPFAVRAPASDRLVRVVAAGRLVEKKGHEVAVRAFAKAARAMPALRLSLIVMARDEFEAARLDALKRLIAAENVADRVDFPPARPYGEYLRELPRYHVHLAPSRHAADGDAEGGAPVTVIEMAASGMPIVASRHCDIPEVAPEGVAGLLFDEGDVDAAAAALLEVARDPSRWSAYGRAARAHVEREYDVRTQARKLEALYDRLVAR